MSDNALTTASKAKPPTGITPLVSKLLDLMVEEGLPYAEAAQRVGMNVRSARKALEKANTLSALRRKRQVFRQSICAGNERRLAELRDQDENRAASVKAIQVLEAIEEADRFAGPKKIVPGVTIIIADRPEQRRPPAIDVTPAEIEPPLDDD